MRVDRNALIYLQDRYFNKPEKTGFYFNNSEFRLELIRKGEVRAVLSGFQINNFQTVANWMANLIVDM